MCIRDRVKTVQKMDGADLAACVPRPCILANDEGYNQEWSTELTVPQAMDEYIKAWCALKVLSKVYGPVSYTHLSLPQEVFSVNASFTLFFCFLPCYNRLILEKSG